MAKIIKIPSVFVHESKVVGVSRHNDDGSSRQEIIQAEVEEGDPLYLEAEPDNPHDPQAVKVLSKRHHQIGYLKRTLAVEVKPALDHKTEVIARATWVNGEEIKGVGIRIELVS